MKKQHPSPLWAESINLWLDSLKAAGYSPNTIGTRRCQMSALSRALEGDPRDVEGDDLLAHFAAKDWKPETRKGAKNACVSYFRWLKASGRSEADPSEFLPTVKRPEPHPRPCPDVVILAALRKATDGERLMLRLGAECGLRRFEIAKVHSRDVMRDLVGWSLVVVGKGDKQRIVPIGDDLALLIRSANGYLFPGRWSGHAESSYVGRHLSDLLGDGWTAHSLRHRYATTTHAATRRPAARLQAPRPRLGRDHATVHRHARRPAARRRGSHAPRRLGGSRCSVSPTRLWY